MGPSSKRILIAFWGPGWSLQGLRPRGREKVDSKPIPLSTDGKRLKTRKSPSTQADVEYSLNPNDSIHWLPDRPFSLSFALAEIITDQIRSTTGKLGCYSGEGEGWPTRRDELDFHKLGHTHTQPESSNLNACDERSCDTLSLVHGYDVPPACGA